MATPDERCAFTLNFVLPGTPSRELLSGWTTAKGGSTVTLILHSRCLVTHIERKRVCEALCDSGMDAFRRASMVNGVQVQAATQEREARPTCMKV